MKKKIILFLSILFITLFSISASTAAAQNSSATPSATEDVELAPVTEPVNDEFSRARVIEVKDEQTNDAGGFSQPLQKVKLKILDGAERDKEIEVDHGGLFAIQEEQKVKVGEEVVVTKTQGPTGALYYITDKYRIKGLAIIFALFFVLAVIFGKVRGFTSIAGLVVSILVLVKFVIPQVLMGRDPVMVSLIGALVIAVVSIYLAHGLNRRSTVALASTVFSLLIAVVLALVFVKLAQLTGTGSEEAIFLRMGPIGSIDLKGLLLGGILIGALGVLDDITISQSASIDEIRKANPNFTRNELFSRGISLGREHIASLINTLALAYAGASFPLLLLFSISESVPFWLTLNSEFIAEEIIRTLVGSTALILAVPISTFLAASFLGANKTNIVEAEVVAPRRKKTKTTRKSKARS